MKYQIEIVTKQDSTFTERVVEFLGIFSKGNYRIIGETLVDADNRDGGEEIWRLIFETDQEFSEVEMDDIGIDPA